MKSFAFKLIKKNFSQRVVKISYDSLINFNNQIDTFKIIEEAYGKDGLGILVVENIPNADEVKSKLFNTGHKLINLPKESLSKLEHPESNYSFGWSYGKEYYFDKPDYFKASYYAYLNKFENNLEHPQNIWCNELPDLKPNFINLGNLIRNIGFHILDHVDNYIKSIYPTYRLNYKKMIQQSSNNVGRLLYYFPKNKMKDHESNSVWCDWHNDHSSLTGLASASYMDENGKISENLKLSKTGLYIQNRKGEVIRTTFGKNDFAFQLGETLQIHSGGLLNATPHGVQVHDDIPENIARCTFALFMGPNLEIKLDLPEGSNESNIFTSDIYKVPKIQHRFKKGMTYGDFHEATINTFYKDSK